MKYPFISIAIKVFALSLGFVKLPVTFVVATRRPVHAAFAVFHTVLDFSFVDFSFLVSDFSFVIFHEFDAYAVVGFIRTGIFVYSERDDLSCL